MVSDASIAEIESLINSKPESVPAVFVLIQSTQESENAEVLSESIQRLLQNENVLLYEESEDVAAVSIQVF